MEKWNPQYMCGLVAGMNGCFFGEICVDHWLQQHRTVIRLGYVTVNVVLPWPPCVDVFVKLTSEVLRIDLERLGSWNIVRYYVKK
jgi:hypothetical protein